MTQVKIEQELIDKAINKIKELEYKLIQHNVLKNYNTHIETVKLVKELENVRGEIRITIPCKIIDRN